MYSVIRAHEIASHFQEFVESSTVGFVPNASACLAQLFHLRSGQPVSLGAMRSTDIFRRENILCVLMEAASTYCQKFGNTATGMQ